jgi:hypothetical protein
VLDIVVGDVEVLQDVSGGAEEPFGGEPMDDIVRNDAGQT